jgi:uncharacterized membrane protein
MKMLSHLSVIFSIVILLLIAVFSVVAAGPYPVLPPGPDAPLHYKARLGLMPPAYAATPTSSSIPYSQLLTPQSPFPMFDAYFTVTVGSWPQVLALAELTGDSHLDAALATGYDFDPANDEQLHFFAGQAGGLPSHTQQLPAGSAPEAIVAGDFDRDGHLDLALALAGEDAVLVYTQTPGVGLASPVTLLLLGEPNAVAAGDFTGDLRDDLAAIAPLSGTLAVWRDWTSQSPATLPYPTGGYDALDVGDLDNDGDDDLVALRGAGYLTESVVIYWQDAGHFPISTTLTPETGGYLPHSLAVGDVTGNGLDDIVVTAGGNAPDAFLNVFAQGVSGPATTPITYAAHHLPSAVVIGDVDHDGLNDVVVTHDAWQTLSVYTQTVSGTLAAYTTAPIPYSDRYRPDALALADLDGNGGLDAALVDRDHGLVILTNTLSAPDAAVVSPTHTALHLPGPLIISGTASADAVTVEVRLKGHTDWTTATLNGATWGLSLTLPSEERAWWIDARAIDAQGRVQSPPDRVRIGVEDGPPRGSLIINDSAYATNQPTVTLTLPAYDVGGVESMRFTPDGQFFTDWITYTRVHTHVFSGGDGLKTLYAQFKSGTETSDLVSDTILLDTAPPASQVAPLPAITFSPHITVTWSGADATSGIAHYDVETKGDVGAWQSLVHQQSLTQTTLQLPVGETHCFRSRATDRAGNVEAWPSGDTGDTCVQVVRSGVALSFPQTAQTGDVGEAVIYHGIVTNTGEATDTIALLGQDNAWPTQIAPEQVELPASASTAVTVTVSVPLTASHAATDVVTLRAQASNASDAAQLMTTASIPQNPYDVSLSPATATKSGQAGARVVYTFTLHNQGTMSDSYTLALDAHEWPTEVGAETVGPLDSEETAMVPVTVTIPQAASALDVDQTALTAQSVASPALSARATFTTRVTPDVAFELLPPMMSLVGNPAQTLTYTFTLYNQGNITDTYTLTPTAAKWPITLTESEVGPVPSQASQRSHLQVTIPATATTGARHSFTLTAASQRGEATQSATLTTWAFTGTITRSVALTVSPPMREGSAGQTLTYTLRITNTSNVTDTFWLAAITAPWQTTITPTYLSLPAYQGQTADVAVKVPAQAIQGESAKMTIRAFGVDVTGAVDVVASVIEDRNAIYLPLVLRQ